MQFSLNFLKQIVDIDSSPKDIAEKLTLAGLEVEEVDKAGDDWIFKVEVTTNRYDWLSVVGVAQEIAALFNKKLKLKCPRLKYIPKLEEKSIFIEDQKDCFYYLGREVKDVKVKDSPGQLKKLIINSGLASVSNVVDITNYSMLKWGNPLHAFDLDKIEGDIYIRRAKKDETFIGIDQKKRLLNSQNLVIADSQKVIALAGVMGAKNTEVTHETRNIFLEAAIFSPVTIRRSRRQAGLETESSYRFERKVSAYLLEFASQEAADLSVELAGGRFSGCGKTGTKIKEKAKEVTLELAKLKSYLGADIKLLEVKKILKSLNFEVKTVSAGKIKVKPHSFRFDIEREVDVYEEFARIYGYDKIAPRIPFLKKKEEPDPALGKKEAFWKFKNKIRDFICLSGFSEIITYSLQDQQELALVSEHQGLSLENPLRSQEDTLRPVLSLGLIKAVRHNLNRAKSNLKFFEIADVYKKGESGAVERPFLSLGVSGSKEKFFLLKGLIVNLLDYLNIDSVKLEPISKKSFTNSLDIIINGKSVGFLGKLDRKTEETFSLKQELFIASCDLSLLKKYQKNKVFSFFSRFPAVWRDISLAAQKNIRFEEVERIIKEKGKYLAGLKVVDTYRGKDLPQGHSAYTLRLFYQSKQKTLSSEEIDSCHNKIREKLSSKDGIILR